MAGLSNFMLLVILGGLSEVRLEGLEWWQTTVFYQIYPRSFKDSDGDGVGDLNGITEKLDHLVDLGVGAVWLSPIYKSPMADFGYDISDFREIDPLFGTMEDFVKLQAKAKELGLKLILDFVPNHSSDEHEWFRKSVQREDPYTDYYVWENGTVGSNGEHIPPNNWISNFHGSAWEWNEARQQFYYHQYVAKQPDLNYRNPAVVQEMMDVLTFWLEKGVDGFRVDAINTLFEDIHLANEPPSEDPNAEEGDPESLEHIYTRNQPETYEMVQKWRTLLDQYHKTHMGDTRVMMVEAYATFENTMKFYGNNTVPGAHFPFNFFFISDLSAESSASDFHDIINQWMGHMTTGKWPNWVNGNHDRHRVATRYGPQLADGMNMLALLLPGVGVTYNGDEIGMEDTYVSWEQTQDPAGINAGPDRYQLFSRDPERTPFQWDNTTNAGFSTNETTWLPVNDNYLNLNLEYQKDVQKSHYKVYKKLVQARSTVTMQKGAVETIAISEGVLSFIRRLEDNPSYVVIINLADNEETINLTQHFQGLAAEMTVYVASTYSEYNDGDAVPTNNIKIGAKDSFVLTDQK